MSEKKDRRVRYTKMVLKQSLLTLLRDRPIEKITVKEICELADINRGTFYTHYTDPYDLLAHIENELYSEILAAIESSLKAEAISGLLEEIFEYIVKNAELCKILFGDYGDKEFIRRVMFIARDQSVAQWKKLMPSVTDEQLDLLYMFYANGCVAMIQYWLQNGMKESPRELARFIEKLSTHGLGAFR